MTVHGEPNYILERQVQTAKLNKQKVQILKQDQNNHRY